MLKKVCLNCGKILNVGENCPCRYRHFDKVERDKGRKKFYNSRHWQALSDFCKMRANGLDEYLFAKGRVVEGKISHHIFTVAENPELKYSSENLIFVSNETHNFIHSEYNKSAEAKEKMQAELKKIRGEG